MLVDKVVNLALEEVPVLDLRSLERFRQAHLKNSSHFPVAELPERMHELPMRTCPISLFGSESELQQASEFFANKGYVIKQKLIATESKIASLNQLGLIVSGEHSHILWRPASIVKSFIQDYVGACDNKTGLDLACGSGRDSVYMAMNGWAMTGVDYLPSALHKLSDLASRNGQSVKTIQYDLEKHASDELTPFSTFEQNFYGCVLVVRYLHRPSIKYLKNIIDRNGYIIYQTFMRGCEKFGSPKNPRYLLEQGELADIFYDFDILLDEIEYLPDGRPTNCFIARKIS